MSDLPLPNSDAQDELQDFFSQEEFLAYFNFYQPAPGGKRTLEGLCKVARPRMGSQSARVNYMCLTFVVDTPNVESEQRIEATLDKLKVSSFKLQLPALQSITSVPASMRRSENYVHQMDLIFSNKSSLDPREVIPVILFTFRNVTGMKTEAPQWWDEEALKAPPPSAMEKANWGNRIKALWGALGK
ncbi:hypothetical protein [Cerasicoccus arenae]|uniref:Uncharacterized protein n=1 Tax=Cerasicoccus arenae TaxID=424488 RepID=A0A8J3DIZ2_9BACT|nr:hypothetical protein [Cerasicoccus arenae]MBK1859463.1 hypothetical protein [Cerasicoccus arenae]GHC13701.1 hypothetical protein GCM10007047_33820 [Cerasicoccus arenae]